ncbi:MAG: hypothetical protein JW881_21270 [Spirochaetales bacterium]|nr:hypothetical protein [Spirochaetales bacterium]
MRNNTFTNKCPGIVCALLLFFATGLSAQTPGDVNGDNTINIVDALLVAQYYVGLNPSPFERDRADTNCSGAVDIVDALLIAQYYVGLIDSLSCDTTPEPTAFATDTPAPTPTETVTAAPTPDPGSTPSGSGVSCAGYPVWNSNVVYDESGTLVQYNCNLYRNSYFSYDQNPEEYSTSEYDTWVLIGTCNDECRMGEGPWVACGEWDDWENGGYTIYNNIWGDGAGTQCIWAESYSNWGVEADHPSTSGVKSYPNVSKNIEKSLSAIGSLSSSFNVTVPGSGAYATTYDVWAGGDQFEIMIWMNKTGAVGPIAGGWDDDGTPIPEATNKSVGGHTWNIYKGNIGFTVISFVRTANTTSGTVNIKALLEWIRDQGWFGDVIVNRVQFGFEITSSPGNLEFICNSYSCN